MAAEISPTYHPEAIKAQAVAAYTYYSSLRQTQRQSPNSALKGADFAASPSEWLTYVSEDQMRERWGDNFDSYYKDLTEAIDAVLGQTLQQDGQLITATYYAISAGYPPKMPRKYSAILEAIWYLWPAREMYMQKDTEQPYL